MRASLNGHGKVSWLAGPYCDGPPRICLRGVGWLGLRGNGSRWGRGVRRRVHGRRAGYCSFNRSESATSVLAATSVAMLARRCPGSLRSPCTMKMLSAA